MGGTFEALSAATDAPLTQASASPIPQSALPNKDEDILNWIRLVRSRRVGPSTFLRLLQEHQTVQASLEALPDLASAAGVSRYQTASRELAEREYEQGCRAGARLVFLGGDGYPALLAQIPLAPPMLWLRGQKDLSPDCVALVGARNASSLGSRMARRLASGLGEAQLNVVSGLARGIDTAAHLGALATGTTAILAGGIDQIYPAENQNLAERIIESGTLVSEQPPGMVPQARHFPIRNRIISGLCQGLVVVEGASRSGSLITARDALDQGREVFAVPGHPLDARASGCNLLIRDGATLVRNAEDILSALGKILPTQPALPLPKPETHSARPTETTIPEGPPKASVTAALDISRRILSLLGPSPVAEDQIIRELNLPAQMVSSEMVTLELEGKLSRQSGGMVNRVV